MKIEARGNLANVKEFCKNFGDMAIAVQLKYDLPALAILGQAALETGWGRFILSAYVNGVKVNTNNIFNIKAGKTWTGKKASRAVWEVINGKNVTIDSWFRVYNSPAESFDNYGEYILNCVLPDGEKRYQRAIDNRTNYIRYIEEVHKAGYATDPQYAKKVCQIIQNYFMLME